jgi:hypothetical protein
LVTKVLQTIDKYFNLLGDFIFIKLLNPLCIFIHNSEFGTLNPEKYIQKSSPLLPNRRGEEKKNGSDIWAHFNRTAKVKKRRVGI